MWNTLCGGDLSMPKTKAAFTLIAGLILILQAAANVALADDGGRSTLNQRRDSPDNVQVTASAVVGAVKTTPATSQAAVGDMQRPPSLSGETNLSLAALGGIFVSLGVWLLRRPVRPIYPLS